MTKTLTDKIRGWEEFAKKAEYSSGTLAKLFGVSDRHLRRVFIELLNCTAQALLDEKKLKDAEVALAAGSLVKGIASDLHYRHSGNFSHWFKARTKMTPSQFLRRGSPSCQRISP